MYVGRSVSTNTSEVSVSNFLDNYYHNSRALKKVAAVVYS